MGPHLVEVGTQARHSFGIQLIQSPRSGPGIEDQAGILEYAQMLRNGGATYRQFAGEFVYGERAVGQLLEDGHAGLVGKGVESGL